MLLERLKKEFDENYEVSKRSQSVAQSNSGFQFEESLHSTQTINSSSNNNNNQMT